MHVGQGGAAVMAVAEALASPPSFAVNDQEDRSRVSKPAEKMTSGLRANTPVWRRLSAAPPSMG
jgi:hypothetical protein